MKEVVSVNWLNQNLNDENLLILDATITAVSDESSIDCNHNTIPRSRYFDLKHNFSDENSRFPNTMPSSEKFELTSQIRRSSRSIGNNIAEGFGRYNYQENIQFCRIARGSLTETLDHVIIALDEGYIEAENLKDYREIHFKTLRILNGYIKYLKDSKFDKN